MPLSQRDVFINVPFDRRGENIFIALVTGLVTLGLRPRSVLEIPPQRSRLDRLVALIRECRYSIHDLSRVGLSTASGHRVPRFNMPFELGLAVGLSLARGQTAHEWWVFESIQHRLPLSLSDLAGYDPGIHGGTVAGVHRALLDAFVVIDKRQLPSWLDERHLMRVYHRASSAREGLPTVFSHRAFRALVLAATLARTELEPPGH